MTKNDYNGDLRLQALSIPEMTEEQLSGIKRGLENCGLTKEMCQNFNQILFTGSGDCLAAAKAASPILNKYLGRFGTNIKVNTPLEFSRYDYLVKRDRNDISARQTLVVIISFFGGPTRLVELIKRARSIGCSTLVITDRPQSPVVAASDNFLEIHHPDFPVDAPGCRSYLGLLLGTILLAAYIDEQRGTAAPGSVNELCNNILAYANDYQKVMEKLDNSMFEVACKWKEIERFEGIADGSPGSSASFFYTAKIIEAFGAFCSFATTSEWRLENRHTANPEKIASLIFADINDSNKDRIREITEMCVQTGRKVLLCCNAPTEIWGIHADIDVCQLPAAPKGYEFLYPVFNFIPGCLLASYLTAFCNETYFRRYENFTGTDLEGKNCKEWDDFSTIRNSEIVIVD